MLSAGSYYNLEIAKLVDFGAYVDADGDEVLLPTRFLPEGSEVGDVVKVFLYHDNENRIIATTQTALAAVGDIALLEAVTLSPHGAFLKWGIMKDVFLPLSNQTHNIALNDHYLVRLYLDEQTGRVTATEKLDKYLSNEVLTVTEGEEVEMILWRETDLGYTVIINGKHTGILYFSDVFRNVSYGEKLSGHIRKIREQNKIDVGLGAKGYQRADNDSTIVLEALKRAGGYLPYHDKSSPEEIYQAFGISKKAFKMAVGALYKARNIELTQTGIKLLE
jgi:predicted RNA-binding protein (virulence factor B family)